MAWTWPGHEPGRGPATVSYGKKIRCVHVLWGLCRVGCVEGVVRWVVRAGVVRLVRSA